MKTSVSGNVSWVISGWDNPFSIRVLSHGRSMTDYMLMRVANGIIASEARSVFEDFGYIMDYAYRDINIPLSVGYSHDFYLTISTDDIEGNRDAINEVQGRMLRAVRLARQRVKSLTARPHFVVKPQRN